MKQRIANTLRALANRLDSGDIVVRIDHKPTWVPLATDDDLNRFVDEVVRSMQRRSRQAGKQTAGPQHGKGQRLT